MYSRLFNTSLLLLILPMTVLSAQNGNHFPLNEGWHFQPSVALRPQDANDLGQNLTAEGYSTKLPNTVLNALFENGVIEDPFYRKNESRLQWLEKKDWIFEKNFDATPEMQSATHVELVLKGLDTYAEVYMNEVLIISADNMFRTWQADIRNFIRPKDNHLKIYFTSPLSKEKTASELSYADFPDVNNTLRMFSRKAQFHYGWDWGPRFVSCGLQNAEIITWSNVIMRDMSIKQLSLANDLAHLQGQVVIESDADNKNVNVDMLFGDILSSQKAILSAGLNTISIDINIPNPIRWWTHNLGKPHLYDVKTTITNPENGKTAVKWAESSIKYGIRTIELVQDKDSKGETFYFKLNGIPIFAKGSNMIPLNIFQERVTSEHIDQIINSATEANMNMLRVWGGGIYQPNEFYEKCDQKGILIWQDFMYACAMYPNETHFLENARLEAVEQVQRLRNHACLALWCGNNEINEAWNNWGWQPRFNPDQKEYIWKAYQDVFQEMLPKVVKENANGTQYYESSPRFGRYNPKSLTEGDNHDWSVWHDEKPFEYFDEKIPRFSSEYGFQSFPDWQTIASFTTPEDRTLESPVMTAHQKHPKGNQIIKKYADKSYKTPKEFENFIYVSQLVQADAIRRAIEAQRRAMPYCMGSLYWQLNDVWPAASWSSIDNFGRWKALQYTARSAFNNILISPVVSKDSFKIHVVNDKLEDIEGDLFVYVMNFAGKVLFMDGRYLTLPANSSKVYYENLLLSMNEKFSANDIFFLINFKPKDRPLIQKTFFLVPPKNLNLEHDVKIFKEVKAVNGGYNIRLRSSSLLKSARLSCDYDGWFDQNYLDVIPNQDYNVFFKTTASLFEVVSSLKVKSLIDIY